MKLPFYLLQTNTEAPENLLHVASLLHRDDTQVILLVHPHQEGLVLIVPVNMIQNVSSCSCKGRILMLVF